MAVVKSSFILKGIISCADMHLDDLRGDLTV